jgi:hypothetical protein
VRAQAQQFGDLVLGDVGEPAQQPPLGSSPRGVSEEQPQLLGGDPGPADLLVDVAGLEPGEQPRPRAVGVVFLAAAQNPPDPKQRVVAATSVSEGVLLDSTTDLLKRGQAQPYHVEGIQHPGGVWQGGAQRGGIATEWVQRRHPNTVPPGLVASGNPAAQGGSASAFDHIQQPWPPVEGDDPGGEPGTRKRGGGPETRSRQPRPCSHARAGRGPRPAECRGRGPLSSRCPADTEIGGHRGHRVPVLPDPPARLPPGPLGEHTPGPNRLAGLGPGALDASWFVATPDPLDPNQRHWPTRRGQIPHPRRPPIMQPGPHATRRAPAVLSSGLDRLLHLAVMLGHGQHPEPGQAQHHRRRDTVITHLGPPVIDGVRRLDREVPGVSQQRRPVLRRGAITTLHCEEPI